MATFRVNIVVGIMTGSVITRTVEADSVEIIDGSLIFKESLPFDQKAITVVYAPGRWLDCAREIVVPE